MDESEVDKVIKEFGNSRTLRSAVLKVERDKKVAVVCDPQVFSGSMFMERESQMVFLDKLGHPRTIQVFETVVKNAGWQKVQWDDNMVETVVNSTMAMVDRYLSEAEIMLLLRPRTFISDIIEDSTLIRALGEGKLYATIIDSFDVVELFASIRGARCVI